jgi:hypothetical protein
MPGKNRNPMLGWHPPAELSAWVRDEAQRRGVTVSTVLNEGMGTLRDHPEAVEATEVDGTLYHPALRTCRGHKVDATPAVQAAKDKGES